VGIAEHKVLRGEHLGKADKSCVWNEGM